jgi:hypothetical protein
MLLAATLLAACRSHDPDADVTRGPGLRAAAELPATDRAGVYRAALAAAFDLTDPALTLLLDPRLLPRTPGFGGGERLATPVVAAMRERGVVQGTCEPPITGARNAPRCDARGPGYVVRFTDVLRLPPDSVEVFLEVRRFDLPSAAAGHYFRFERAYEIIGAGNDWRAAREGRIPDPPPHID